jgi:hypothetical protein
MSCRICNKSDLFLDVTGELVCGICKLVHIGGLPTTQARVDEARARLGLKPGEYWQNDQAANAAAIPGRRR